MMGKQAAEQLLCPKQQRGSPQMKHVKKEAVKAEVSSRSARREPPVNLRHAVALEGIGRGLAHPFITAEGRAELEAYRAGFLARIALIATWPRPPRKRTTSS